MPQAPQIDELKWKSLTATVNEIKSPNRFLQRRVFNQTQTFPTETIEYGQLNGARNAAPFVRRDSESKLVGGTNFDIQQVATPNIRMKRAFTPSQVLFGRQPGTVVYAGRQSVTSAVRQHIARDLQFMADMATNAEEYMCAQALQGQVSYSVEGEDNFTVTYPKPAGNNITLSVFWDDVANATPFQDIHNVKRILSDEVGLAPTDMILGSQAADAVIALAEAGAITLIKTDSGVEAGTLSLATQFDQDGVILLGRLSGINVWEYSRTVTLSDGKGATVSLIRPKYAEFICATAAAEYWRYYGAIPDLGAFEGNMLQAARYSKSWMQEDPSALMALLHTRPLPVLKRPGAVVSVKVVSG